MSKLDPALQRMAQTLPVIDSFDLRSLKWYTASRWRSLRLAVSVGGAVDAVREGAERSCRGWKKEPSDQIIEPKSIIKNAQEVNDATLKTAR